MGLVGRVIVGLVLAGASWGFLTWAADGRQPLSEGWWPALQDNVSSAVNFGGDNVREKLPDPEGLPLPEMDSDGQGLDQDFGGVDEIPGAPEFAPLDPAGDGPPAIPIP